MAWLNHPLFIPRRDAFVARLNKKDHVFRRLDRVAFICGGANFPRRADLENYFARRVRRARTFRAEAVWVEISRNHPSYSALQMEDLLAQLSDIVIIIVESPGTFAELGAFCLSPALRSKLLPIIDQRYRTDESFINTGPVKWIDDDSGFAPTIFADFSAILSCSGEIEERLRRIPSESKKKVDVSTSRKHLLFFLCDIVTVAGPVLPSDVSFYIANTVGRVPDAELRTLLEVAATLGLIDSRKISGQQYYFPRFVNKGLLSYVRRKYVNAPAERAEFLAAMQNIEEASNVLEACR